MKKILSCILILLIIFCAGCSKEPTAEFVVPTPAPENTPSAAPTPQAIPTPSPEPEPTPEPDALTAQEGVYTIGWISDTQHYSKKFDHYFYEMTEFLANEQQRLNLGYIVHTGDLVHNFDIEDEWKIADKALETIDHIPNGVLAGNHDYNSEAWTYNEYAKYFGESRYSDKTWYGGSHENNRCHYDLITLGETDYLFVYVSHAPDSSAIKWASDILAQYPDRVGILCVHDYFDRENELSPDGNELFKKVVKKNPNVYMVLCGHRYTLYAEDVSLDDDGDGTADRTVHQVMANYQAAGAEGGDGYMRFLQVNEAAGTIQMYSYSPTADDYTYFDTPERLEEKYASDAKYEEYQISIPWMQTQE